MRPAPLVSPAAIPRPWWGIVYFGIYLAYLFASLEGELLHWLSLVIFPIALTWATLPDRAGTARLSRALALCGLRRGRLSRGLGLAVVSGVVLGLAQLLVSGQRASFLEIVRSGRVAWLLPLAFALMLGTAAFTEEFFFRGFLQTRVEALSRSRVVGLVVTAVLFGLYHLPYAYLNPAWPSAGDWGAAWGAAMGQGFVGGMVLGAVYLLADRNLLAPVVVHASINAFPATSLIRFGGS